MKFNFSLTKPFLVISTLFILGSCSDDFVLETKAAEKVKRESV